MMQFPIPCGGHGGGGHEHPPHVRLGIVKVGMHAQPLDSTIQIHAAITGVYLQTRPSSHELCIPQADQPVDDGPPL